MAELAVYWERPKVDRDAGKMTDDEAVLQRILTGVHQAAPGDRPVVVENLSQRAYQAGDLPPGTVVYVKGSPYAEPELMETAKRAGFEVALAADTEPSRE